MRRARTPAVGQRIGWSDLPADVQRGIEGVLGCRVIAAESQAGGLSPGTADRVRTETGRRAFVKAVSPDQNPESPDLLRRGADTTTPCRGAPCNRPIGRYDDGDWIGVAMEEMDGRCPPVPWSDEHVHAAMDTLAELAADLNPSPIAGLPPVAEGLASIFDGWERLRISRTRPRPWVAARLDELIEMSAGALHRLKGDTVVHCDIRAATCWCGPTVPWSWSTGRGR